jgi:ATP-dependent helicase IRC3
VVGVTATPERGDRQSLRQVFDRIVYQKTLLEMMQAGYLVDLRALQVLLQADFDALRTQHGDFVEAELETLLLEANAPAQVLTAFQAYAAARKALLFTPTVATAYAMADTFCTAGIPAEALDGTTPLATRRAILQRLHTGATRVVANCAVLTEGFDEPSVDCIIVARPTQSALLYQQMLGRGTRTYPGKTDCLVLDVVGVSTSPVKVILPPVFCYPLGLLSRHTEGGHHARQSVRPFCGKKSHFRDGAWHAGTRSGNRPTRCLVCPDGPEAVYPHRVVFDGL